MFDDVDTSDFKFVDTSPDVVVADVVEVSDVFWNVVMVLAGSMTTASTPEMVHKAFFQNDSDDRVEAGQQIPMLTGEAIALPRAYMQRLQCGVGEEDDVMHREFVFHDVMCMMDAVHNMYDQAACMVQESLSQRRRRFTLQRAMDKTMRCNSTAVFDQCL